MATSSIDGKPWTAWWRSEPAAIPVGAHFSIRFHLCGAAGRPGRGARLDAGPPPRHELPARGDPSRRLSLHMSVAGDFIPTMEALLGREKKPDQIVIETSGLAMPKPLVKAFNWPDIRTRVTVDAVVTVVDGPAVAEGLFASDPEAVQAQREDDDALEHESPLEELFRGAARLRGHGGHQQDRPARGRCARLRVKTACIHAAQPADSTSACSSTVRVAFSCLSGG